MERNGCAVPTGTVTGSAPGSGRTSEAVFSWRHPVIVSFLANPCEKRWELWSPVNWEGETREVRDMADNEAVSEEQPKRRRGKGCLLAVAVVVGLFIWSQWEIGEPGRRARAVYASTRPGMTPAQIEGLLSGRYLVHYEVCYTGRWQSVASRDEFVAVIGGPHDRSLSGGRMKMTFLSRMASPGRMTLGMQFGTNGVVTVVEPPEWSD